MQKIDCLIKTFWKYALACLVIVGCFLPSYCLADYPQRLQINFSFDPPEGKTIAAYRLYKDGHLVCEENTDEDNNLICEFESNAGTYNFTLSALYDDDTESGRSAPFPYSLYDLSSVLKGLLVLTGQQQPSGIDNFGDVRGVSAIDFADILHVIRKGAPELQASATAEEETSSAVKAPTAEPDTGGGPEGGAPPSGS